jgi:hypothetical protein
MRDLRHFRDAGYVVRAVQPFDLFPQTRHLECIITLERDAAAAQLAAANVGLTRSPASMTSGTEVASPSPSSDSSADPTETTA